MNICKCPQCQRDINESSNRIVQDSCGHKKCRICLLEDEVSCKTCQENKNFNAKHNNNNPSNISVIKFDTKFQNETNTQKNEGNIEKIQTENISNKATEKTDSYNFKRKLVRKPLSIPSHITVVTKLPQSYKCNICEKTFSTIASVKYHMYCSGIEKPLKCEICNKGFISRAHLETHNLKHTGMKPYVCSKCQKGFTQRSKLNRHMKLHTGEKPFVCSECGKKFTNKDAMNGHYRIHTGAKPYACKHCENRFNNKSNLTKHMLTHSKDKLYMCEECGKKFSNKWALLNHIKCHSRERLHSCQKCSRSFTTVKDLKRHGIIHLDVKPFGCKLCNTKFCRKDNLERHLKNTHSMKLPSEIKGATIKYGINKKIIETITSNTNKETEISKVETQLQNKIGNKIPDTPNAINVIKTSNGNEQKDISTIRNTVPVINGPFKLAFKTDAFRNNYNILNKNYTDLPPRIQPKKPYDMAESMNICQKILSPMNTTKNNLDITKSPLSDKPKNVIMSVGKVNEKESLEICKKILTPIDVSTLHYETSFESKKHAVIKNIKFKLPSTYTNNVMKSCDTTYEDNLKSTLEHIASVAKSDTNENSYTELQPMKPYLELDGLNKQSVIVNRQSTETLPQIKANSNPQMEMHWRRRTSQTLQPKTNNS